jgi:hypothetical protein
MRERGYTATEHSSIHPLCLPALPSIIPPSNLGAARLEEAAGDVGVRAPPTGRALPPLPELDLVRNDAREDHTYRSMIRAHQERPSTPTGRVLSSAQLPQPDNLPHETNED